MKETLHALLIHTINQDLPRVLRIHGRLSYGDQIKADEMVFMQTICKTIGAMKNFVDNDQEYQGILSKYIILVSEVTQMALANEKEHVCG